MDLLVRDVSCLGIRPSSYGGHGNNFESALAAIMLAGVFAAGAVPAPAQATGENNSGNAKLVATYSSEQTSSPTALIDQNSGMVGRPHQIQHYAVTNFSYVDQHGQTTTTATGFDGDLDIANTVYQEISNSARIKQGTTKALPHSTVYYGGVSTSDIEQYAENTATTVTESGGPVDSGETVNQEASNTANVQQGTVHQFRHSTVYDTGANTSVVLQAGGNTRG